MRHCKSLTKDKNQCKSAPILGSDFCISHDPAWADTKALAVKLGGQRSSKRDLKEVTKALGGWYKVRTAKEASRIAELCVNLLLMGKLDASTAMAVHNHLNTIMKAREQSDLEKRIDLLEEKEKEKR